jgi:hypothetical protein
MMKGKTIEEGYVIEYDVLFLHDVHAICEKDSVV